MLSFEFSQTNDREISADEINNAYEKLKAETARLKYDQKFWQCLLYNEVYLDTYDGQFYTLQNYDGYYETVTSSWPKDGYPLSYFLCAVCYYCNDLAPLTPSLMYSAMVQGDCTDVTYCDGAIYITWDCPDIYCSIIYKYSIVQGCIIGMSFKSNS